MISMMLIEDVDLYIKGKINSVDVSSVKENLNNPSYLSFLTNFRNTKKWINYENKSFLIKDLSNDHLINVIGHLSTLNNYDLGFRNHLIHEFFYRGLPLNELKRFQIPHIKDGKKVLMSYDDKNFGEIYPVVE